MYRRIFLFSVVLSCGLAASCNPGSAPPAPSARAVDSAVEVRLEGGDWPRWGGPRGDFHAAERTLASSWPAAGPPVVWERPFGPGYSAVVVRGTRLYTMYRDGDDEIVVALDAGDGGTIWEHRYAAKAREKNQSQFGTGPNATPLILGDRLIALGYTGMLHGLELETGRLVWSHDLIEDFGGEVLDFGYSASPMPHDGNAIVLVGGSRHAAVAFDPADGSTVWDSPPGSISYATPVAIEVDGQPQLVYMSADEVVGIDADGGARLWSHPCVNQYANNATDPRWDGEDLLWVATQLDGGARALRLSREGDTTRVEEVWTNDRIKVHFWNSVRVGDRVFAALGTQGAMFLAGTDLYTGEVLWKQRGYRLANLVQVGDRTLLLDADGRLALLKLSDEGAEVLAEAHVTEEETWTPPALVGTTLFVRDRTRLRALDLGG